MRTNIEIDDALIRQVMKHTNYRTKRAAVDAALRLLLRTRQQGAILKLRGKIQWQGDLNESRLGRYPR